MTMQAPQTQSYNLEPQSRTRQEAFTVMETQMTPQTRTVMREQRSQTMTQTMETQMVPQPRTVMVPQKTMTMAQTMEPVTQSVPRMTMKPVVTYRDIEEAVTTMVPE